MDHRIVSIIWIVRCSNVRFIAASSRRARLIGGPDVWEVIAVARDNDGDLRETASYLELPLGLVQAAAASYGAYAQEIDERIELGRRQNEEAHMAFLAGGRALGG